MKAATASKVFMSGAIFNWAVALTLLFIPGEFLNLLSVTPAPQQLLWVQQFAGLVLVFGIGYYWASRDFEKNIQIIRMAVIGKLGVVLIGLVNVATGDISWQFMLPASGDLCFAILFIVALNCQPTWAGANPTYCVRNGQSHAQLPVGHRWQSSGCAYTGWQIQCAEIPHPCLTGASCQFLCE